MQFRIEKKEAFQAVGFMREFDPEDSYRKIPLFWDEVTERYAPHLMKGEAPEGELEIFIAQARIGELGVCIDDMAGGCFHYMVGGYCAGGDIPEGLSLQKIPAGTWAVFDCTLKTLQDTNTAIWKEWLPGNSEYEISGTCSLEWYAPEDPGTPAQVCQIWIPVKRR